LELAYKTKRSQGKDFHSTLSWVGNFTLSDANIKVEGEVAQKGEVSEKVTIKGLHEGLTVELSGKVLTERDENAKKLENPQEEEKQSRDTFGLGLTYNHKLVDTNLSISKKTFNPFLLSGSVAGKYEDFSAGFDFQLEIQKEEKEVKEEKKEEKKNLMIKKNQYLKISILEHLINHKTYYSWQLLKKV